MAQDDNKQMPGFNRGSDDKKSKKPPKFSIYWIYALIAIALIGYQFLQKNSPDAGTISFQEFKQNMLIPGDVDHLELVKNKEVVRVYIKSDSLKKSYYASKLKHDYTGQEITGPLFEFQVTDWESYHNAMSDFYKSY